MSEQDDNSEMIKHPLWRRFLWLHIAVFAAFCFLLYLGFWQLERLRWKEQLIERAENKTRLPAVTAPGPAIWSAMVSEEIDYLPVKLRGKFLPGELYYFDTLTSPRGALGGMGYFVYSPFRAKSGWTVLVNRGFITREAFEQKQGAYQPIPAGIVEILGLARRAEVPSSFSAEPNLKTGEWYVREPRKMARALGLDIRRTAPFTIDLAKGVLVADATGLPQAGETRMTFKNSHLQYALTWFGLAGALLAVYVAFLFTATQKRSNKDDADGVFEDNATEELQEKSFLKKFAFKKSVD